jgi:type II secretory pathway component GspD/PulD (secretin)
MARPTLEDRLIKLIVSTVDPQSWDNQGGPGTVDYFPLGMALVVKQTPAVQEQVADLLAALRHLQDTEVAVEVRFLTVPETFLERVGVDFNASPPALGQVADLSHPQPAEEHAAVNTPAHAMKMAFLSDAQVFQFMEAVQGDPRSNVMQAPKMTVCNGQASLMSITDQHYFVTGINAVQVGDQVAYSPKNEAIPIGLRMAVQPVVSADRRYVFLNLKINQTELAGPVALIPVMTPAKVTNPEHEDGGKVVPFTQFLQQPTVNTMAVDQTLTVPDGGTVVLGGGTRVTEMRNEFGPPVLSKVPYVNRLFRNVGTSKETLQVLVMVTPRIIVHQEEETKVPPRTAPAVACPAPVASEPVLTRPAAATAGGSEAQEAMPHARKVSRQHKLTETLTKYHEACAAGDLPLVRKMALRALAIDPACFDKAHAEK